MLIVAELNVQKQRSFQSIPLILTVISVRTHKAWGEMTLPSYSNLLSPSRMRTSCSPCSCLTTWSKDLDQRVRWHQGGDCVCKRNGHWKARVCECVCACVCVCGRLLTCKLVLVCLLRAVRPDGTETPSPSSWTRSDISPSSNGLPHHAEP